MADKKQKGFRLDVDIIDELGALAREVAMDESELVRRLLRYGIRAARQDRGMLLSKEASESLTPPPPKKR